MKAQLEFPRMLYKGPPTDAAQTCIVADHDALVKAVDDGWRLQRADPDQEVEPADLTKLQYPHYSHKRVLVPDDDPTAKAQPPHKAPKTQGAPPPGETGPLPPARKV
jgi:hypothetical protein